MFELEFDCGNAAFGGDDLQFEVARILKKVGTQIENGQDFGTIHDINGNKIGSWYLGVEREEDDERN